VDGTCSSMCQSCEAARTGLVGTTLAARGFGYYPKGCMDVVGYAWAPCDTAARPTNAVWTSSTTVAGASRGCSWQCAVVAPPAYAWNGGCLACFAYSPAKVATTCVSGQVVRYCDAGKTLVTCQPCIGGAITATPYQAWRSDAPDFLLCVADCEEGVAFRASANSSVCTLCSRVQCALGELYVPCTRRADAACVTCAPPPLNAEFMTEGSCLTRCQVLNNNDAFCRRSLTLALT
jgi:hypothetical protein